MEVVGMVDIQVPAPNLWWCQIKSGHSSASDFPEDIVAALILVPNMNLHRDNSIHLLSVGIDPVPGECVLEPWISLKHSDIFDALDVDFEMDQGEVGGDGVRSHLDEDNWLVSLRLTAMVD